jgi:hypothetical protein
LRSTAFEERPGGLEVKGERRVLRDFGIEGLRDKINKLKEIEFLQFLNS